ncbi:MAG: rhomboid family intramembrane serine protease [Bacteroidota bacterium]|nr:rhomboid family intramembrane serine protease [Bacteroidota bacterium]MDP4233544.1 rhomboid family intramembrane serine protease [Bacteroidota bacterium]MDP4244031.1 rhomboid family intramembrane serine protease [Bacteroidota bacterium]MDP4287730.1 rhomboid family intramembrane serine protease [Bacteroidota bacterium]
MAWTPQQQQRPQMPRGFGGFSFFPPAIKFLLIANGGVFLFQMLFGAFHMAGHESLSSFILQYLALWPPDSHFFYPWQLVSYMFLHEGFTHILFNMLALWMFGVEVENAWGTKKFITYYLICGLGGAASHLMLSGFFGAEGGPLIGASGAIFGVLVAFGLMFPNRPIYFFPLFFIGIPAKFFVAGYMALELYMTYNGGDNISHLAHLGGAVTGIVYILITTGGHLLRMRRQSPQGTSAWQGAQPSAPRSGTGFFGRPRARTQGTAVDAEYRDINGHPADTTTTQADVKKARTITQEEIDRILDKIAATGYQNLTTEERDILFEASRRMEERK